MFYENLLKSHIILEFVHGKTNKDNLLETRSVVPNIDIIVNNIFQAVSKQMFETISKKTETIQKYTEKEINLNKAFFNEIDLTVTFKFNTKTRYKGNFQPLLSFKNNFFKPHIQIIVYAFDKEKMYKTFIFTVAHELTHAYNYYQYFRKHGFPESKEDILKAGLVRQQIAINSFGNEQAIGLLNYKLSKKELNAFLGQLRQELLPYKEKIIDSKSAFFFIKNSESYQKGFCGIEKIIASLINIENIEVQEQIIFFTNMITDRRFTTYNQVKKFYLNRWYKWSKQYLTKASKIAYDVFEENNSLYVE